MLDASSHQPNGIMFGNVYQMGNFDQCLEVRKPITTQYCLVKVSVKVTLDFTSSDFNPFVQQYDPYMSAWHRIQVN